MSSAIRFVVASLHLPIQSQRVCQLDQRRPPTAGEDERSAETQFGTSAGENRGSQSQAEYVHVGLHTQDINMYSTGGQEHSQLEGSAQDGSQNGANGDQNIDDFLVEMRREAELAAEARERVMRSLSGDNDAKTKQKRKQTQQDAPYRLPQKQSKLVV